MLKRYKVNEIFFSLQGEGVRAGTPNVFVRFSNCNLACRKDGPMGFDCDTEFESGAEISAEEIVSEAERLAGDCKNVIFTGGEPALQLDDHLMGMFHGWHRAIETNGTVALALAEALEFICVSPKTAEHTLKQLVANEVKYVRRRGQEIPKSVVNACDYLLSPAFEGTGVPRENLEWCIELVKKNPMWRLSLQQHKWWGVR